ncbi:MAG: 23S rRNA (uracil(1939)-C(5))-methyltransferase RlmD [Gammaproteobacteria bacterium]
MGQAERSPGSSAVEIESLAHDGRGVARIAGKAAFVEGALPGERVLFKRQRTRRGFDEGVATDILETSPRRVEPRCPHFGVCGGCALQHMDAEAQIDAKQAVLLDNLDRIGRLTPKEVLPPLQGPAWGYRRRARLGAKYLPAQRRLLLGFRQRRSARLTDMRTCEVLDPRIGRRIEALADLLGGLSIARHLPQIEVAVADNAVVLVLRVMREPSPEDRDRLRAFAASHGVEFHLQPGGEDSIAPLDPPAVELSFEPEAGGPQLFFRPGDFIQVNDAVNQAMVARALELVAPSPGERVLDLFCGLGNFSLPLAARGARVTGIEGDPGLVARARDNARRNGLSGAEFSVANLFNPDFRAQPWWRDGCDQLLLDPPRSGADAVARHIAEVSPRRIVYVSCHPASLARDAATLCVEGGYRLVAAGVLDMFPQTAHVESMAVFE